MKRYIGINRAAAIFFAINATMFSLGAFAKDTYIASIAQMPGYAESAEKGILVDFVKALAAASKKKMEIRVVPFARSIASVEQKQVDFHMPLIKIPNTEKGTATFDYSTENIFHVNFTLYTNKNSKITKETAAKFKVQTDSAHVQYFPEIPKIEKSTSLENSIKMVDAGRIDGFIFADLAIDPIIKAQGLKNIKRELYQRFDVKIILPKDTRGGETDKLLSTTIAELQKNGTFAKIMGPIDAPFDSWQP